LSQAAKGREAQTERFDGFSAREFLKQLIQLTGVSANEPLQSPLIAVHPKDYARCGDDRSQ
ncbi:hypothetical protein, partial [Pseudomonas viridiflava]|uniref:hypothetical protein n=1 Tax=Pseudomonas viridiflava TaxID=33069 RepID=UPI00197DB8AD